MIEVYHLARSAFEQLVAQARAGFPFEVCGFVGGPQSGSGLAIRPATNVSSHPRDAYDIAPEETLAVLLGFENRGSKITGLYHSHPNYPARPSQVDLRLADMPDVCYLIVGVQERGSQLEFDLRAYRISQQKAYPVRLELID